MVLMAIGCGFLSLSDRRRGDDHVVQCEPVVAQPLAALVGQRAGRDLRLDRLFEPGEAVGRRRAGHQHNRQQAAAARPMIRICAISTPRVGCSKEIAVLTNRAAETQRARRT